MLLFLLLASEDVLDKIGLQEIETESRSVFGVLSIYSFAALAIHVGVLISGWVATSVRRRSVTSKRHNGLHSLTGEEKDYLRGFIEQKTKTQDFPYDSGIVLGLQNAGIIFLSARTGRDFGLWQFNLNDWAWRYLNKHPECLK